MPAPYLHPRLLRLLRPAPSRRFFGSEALLASAATMAASGIASGSEWSSAEMFDSPVDSGTTIIAVEFDGGVVLAADSRTSTGSYVANRVSDKLTAVHDLVYCCRSGSAADTQAISDYVRRYLAEHAIEKGSLPTVKTAATLFRSMCYANKDRLLAGIICAGWDPVAGGSVYTIPLGGSLIRERFAVGGSGSTYIYGFVDSHFKEGMSKDECLDFVRRAVAHAMARDGSSGGVIRTVVITKDGVERGFVKGDELPFLAY